MKLKTCQNCKKRIGENDYYCPYCNEISNVKDNDNYNLKKEISSTINYCGQCGIEVSKRAKYCHKCGNEIYDKISEKKDDEKFFFKTWIIRRFFSNIPLLILSLIILYVFYLILKFIGSLD